MVLVSLTVVSCGWAGARGVRTATPLVETEEAPREAAPEIDNGTPEVTSEPTVTPEVVDEATRQAEDELVEILLWTDEDEGAGGLHFIRLLTQDYVSRHPNLRFEIVSKDFQSLEEDFVAASSAGDGPDLLWTTSDLDRLFRDDDLILPLSGLLDLDEFVDSALAAVQMDDETWGVPISTGGHLMVMYNKELMVSPPGTTDELIEVGQQLTSGDQYGLVYNQTDPQWLVPWLGGFGGSVFVHDASTPTLNTPAMVSTLQFLHDIQYETPLGPADTDYDGARLLFSRGRAAMVIDGHWALQDYRAALGDALGVARIPKVTATDEWPRPYLDVSCLALPIKVEEDPVKLNVAIDFVQFVISVENQVLVITELNRLPTLKEALESPLLTNDPVLMGSAEQMMVGKPAPRGSEMQCNWDAMRREMGAAIAGNKSAEQAAMDMQRAAEICIESLKAGDTD